jgi:hypothetical protein
MSQPLLVFRDGSPAVVTCEGCKETAPVFVWRVIREHRSEVDRDTCRMQQTISPLFVTEWVMPKGWRRMMITESTGEQEGGMATAIQWCPRCWNKGVREGFRLPVQFADEPAAIVR